MSAWFPKGKNDPDLTLIRFDLDDAAVWLSEAGPIKFAFEIAKANLSGRQPDVGESANIRLN